MRRQQQPITSFVYWRREDDKVVIVHDDLYRRQGSKHFMILPGSRMKELAREIRAAANKQQELQGRMDSKHSQQGHERGMPANGTDG